MLGLDWGELFLPSGPILELVLRGSLVYLGLFLFLRFFLKRESGTVGITDLLLVVLLSTAVENSLIKDFSSITDGFIVVLTIMLWSYLLNYLGYKFPLFQKLVHPPSLPLIKNGNLQRRNMRHELITEDELLAKVREQGISDLSEVKEAYIEGDGHISVIAKKKR